MPRARKPKAPVESPRLPSAFVRAELDRVIKTYARNTGLGSWTHDTVLAAREAQSRGDFCQPVKLGRAILSDPSIFKALTNRLAPHRGLPREIRSPHPLTGSALAILDEAKATFTGNSSSLPFGVIADAFIQLAIHEISILQIRWETRPDGSREDAFVSLFDLECCKWDERERKLYAFTTEGRVEVVHGDGRWIVIQKYDDQPWTKAGLIALAALWADVALGRLYRSRNAKSHGDDKWVGVLPPGVAIDSPEGVAMLAELVKMYEPQRAMLIPHGSTVKREEAMSSNWQIFKELVEADGRDAAGILVGQDGTTANAGGNYVKSWMLYGVRNDIVESDLSSAGYALATGLLRPWSIRNFGKWDRLEYAWGFPDADEDARRESIAGRWDSFNRIVKETRETGAVVDQVFVDALASSLGLVAPKLADSTPSGADFFAYELEGGVVTIDEVRARKGLPPLPNGRGAMTVPEARARSEAVAAPTPAAAGDTYPRSAA